MKLKNLYYQEINLELKFEYRVSQFSILLLK